MPGPTRILFVCMGNICRSPMAEGVFLHISKQAGTSDRFHVDSAGTGGWHVGDPADPRSRDVASRHGIELTSRARQVMDEDFHEFDLIVCMDRDNRDHLIADGAPADKVVLLLQYDTSITLDEVPDPYYGGPDGFDHMYDLIDASCRKLHEHLV
ncbi:MAG: protein tyrosine phosphatase [Phycisphaerae bacterium]|nr:protein tyrosine phosphatase [Phycisphaerae bacterium]